MSLEEFVRPIDPLARLPSCFGQSIALASFDECDCREIESASSEFQRVSECNLTSKSDHKPVLLDQPRRHHFGLALIALFKLLKGFLLLAAAIGLLNLMHSDVSATVEHWITVLRMDPDNQYFRWLLEKVGGISPEQIRAVSVGSFFYAGFLLTEGIGLWFE